MMDLCRIIKREPEKKSGADKLIKAMIVIGSIAAAGLLVLALYKKWKECNCADLGYDDFDDEWFCDCDDCGGFDESGEPECVCCPDESCDCGCDCEDGCDCDCEDDE